MRQDAYLAEMCVLLEVTHSQVSFLLVILVRFEDLDGTFKYYIECCSFVSFPYYIFVLPKSDFFNVLSQLQFKVIIVSVKKWDLIQNRGQLGLPFVIREGNDCFKNGAVERVQLAIIVDSKDGC